MTEDIVRVYCGIIDKALRRCHRHSDWEDIRGEARLAVWRMLAKLPEADREEAFGLVRVVAISAAVDWFRSPRNPYRGYTQHGVPVPKLLRWGLFLTDERAADEQSAAEFQRWNFARMVPDFAPRLIHQLWAEEVWDAARAALPPDQWEALQARALSDITFKELAQGLPIDWRALEARAYKARVKLRVALEDLL